MKEKKFRSIKTKIPGPETASIIEIMDKYESQSMNSALPVWDHAHGFNVYDKSGNCWLDFTSGILFANVGHSNEAVMEAVKNMLDKQLIHSHCYATEIRANYVKKLIEFSPEELKKAFLVSSGTEAIEAALRLINLHGQKVGKKHLGLICIETNYHGRTMGASQMCHSPILNSWIENRDPNFHYIPFPYPWVLNGKSGKEFLEGSLKRLEDNGVNIKEDIAGFMLEAYQGWTCSFYPNDYVQEIRKICDDNNIILAFDEMQSGFGRTGKTFGYQHYNVTADLISCGKAMGGGFPLSGVLGSKTLLDLPKKGSLSSTHSGNPIVCAAGTAVIEEINRMDLIHEAERKGKILHKGLNALKEEFPNRISRILGKGLIAMIFFKQSDSDDGDSELAKKVANYCLENGLLVLGGNPEMIKLGPPLIIPDEAIEDAISVLRAAIKENI